MAVGFACWLVVFVTYTNVSLLGRRPSAEKMPLSGWPKGESVRHWLIND